MGPLTAISNEFPVVKFITEDRAHAGAVTKYSNCGEFDWQFGIEAVIPIPGGCFQLTDAVGVAK